MQKGLVSVLTPCYNTAHLVYRLLDSVVSQSYPNIEMFLIDDGSTDDLKDVYELYKMKFNNRGYTLNYIYQKNQGQSAAINNGLKLINGEYLIWPDSDDWFKSDEAIECFVHALESCDESYGVVRCAPTYVNENGTIELKNLDYSVDPQQFSNCLYCDRFFWGAGNYMVKVEALEKTIRGDIYIAKNAGQNWQLLLPVLYNYNCLTLSNSFYSVLERKDSHSRGLYAATLESQLLKIQSYEDTIIGTLSKIEMDHVEREKYKNNIHTKYLSEKVSVALDYRNGSKALDFYKKYYRCGGRLSKKRVVLIYILNIPIISQIYSKVAKYVRNKD